MYPNNTWLTNLFFFSCGRGDSINILYGPGVIRLPFVFVVSGAHNNMNVIKLCVNNSYVKMCIWVLFNFTFR